MNRCLALLMAPMVLVSCSHEPPAYESKYVPPTTSTLQNTEQPVEPTPQNDVLPPEPIAATFFDYFDRPNTTYGLGEGWDMRGRDPRIDPDANSFPLPAASDGYIADGNFTYTGGSMVYAVRQFDGPVRSIGAEARWRSVGTGTETTLAMGITANDLVVADMVHFVVNRSSWKVTLRRGAGSFEPVLGGRFTPILELDRDYRFEIEATDARITVRVPGTEESKDVPTAGLVGDRAFWEQYPNGTPAGNVLDVDTVWATVEGQPLTVSTDN
ncbi:hypothetical protein [Mycobacterium sp. C31M]